MEKNDDKNVVSIFGLVIFFIFVIVLAIVSRTNKPDGKTALEEFTEKNKNNSPVEEKMNEAKTSSESKTIFDDLKDNSYEFIYTIDDNGNKTIYSGKKNGNKMVVDIINKGSNRYYQVGENYLDKDFKTIDKIPMEYSKFINFDKLNRICKYSVTGDNGKGDISVYDIYDTYYLDFMYDPFDIDDVEDSTIEITMADGYVSKVVLDYSTALTYMNQKDYTFVITMEFSNVGKVGDIEIG